MKKLLFTIAFILFVFTNVFSQCIGDEQAGKKALPGGATDRIVSYNIKHTFTLYPGGVVSPLVKIISYNHSFTKELSPLCLDSMTIPAAQPLEYRYTGKDTMVGEDIQNNGTIVNYKITTVPSGGMTITDSAYSYNCVSASNALTCIHVAPFGIGTPVSGVIRTYGFGQSINPPSLSDAYAVSLGDVSAQGGKLLRSGAISWDPIIASKGSGKSHIIRQKAGTHDPITYFVHDFNTGLNFNGTLFTTYMTHYTSSDTVSYTNYWQNDTVRIESDTAEFFIQYPSPTITSLNGTLQVLVSGGFVTAATASGSFSSVTLPLIGSPTPVVFALNSLQFFNYNLGSFNNDSLLVKINMYGYSENIDVPTTVNILIKDSIVNPKCNQGKDGKIYITPSGGTAPYTYLWNDGKSTKNRTNLKSGTYTVTVTDAFSNTASKTIFVSEPTAIVISITKTNIKCGGASTGSATATATGGTPGYTFMWTPGGVAGNTISNIPAGVYIVMVTDANGCTKSKSVTITENPPLSLIVSSNSATSATALGSGGVGLLSYRWFTTPVQNTATATGLVVGIAYVVRVTDSKGCSLTITYVHHLPRIGSTSENEFAVSIMPNPSKGKVAVQINNPASANYSFKLHDLIGRLMYENELTSTDSKFDFDFSNLPPGIYSLTISNGDKFKMIKVIIE